jgi:hypothetical protein
MVAAVAEPLGKSLKQFPQPARVITVSPDYVFAVKNFVLGNCAVCGSILTAIIIIPAFIWMLRKVKKRREEKDEEELAAKKRSDSETPPVGQ